jgi:hypothetical protein
MSQVVLVALPVFAVILAGLIAGRMRFATAEDSAVLNKFVFRFAMPAALFGLMAGAHGLRSADALFALAFGAPALLVMAAAYALGRALLKLPEAEAGVHALASSFGNAVFLGLPIALSVEGWARPFVILMLVEGVVIIGLGAALIDRRGAGFVSFLVRPLKNPLVVAAIAGFAFASLGGVLPEPLRRTVDILGRAAGGTALFSLGLFFETRSLPKISEVAPNVAMIALLKMVALPALTLGALHVAGIVDTAHLGAAMLFTATPVAVGSFVMASQYKAYERECAAAIAATTALSVLSISAVLVVFG